MAVGITKSHTASVYAPCVLRSRLLKVAMPSTTGTLTMLLLLKPVGPVYTAIVTDELSLVTMLPN